MAKTKKYRSKYEEGIANQLEASVIPYQYEAESFKYVRQCTYLTDFRVLGPNGPIHIEAKGWFTSADRTKLLLVREQNPWIDIRILFQRPSNTLSKKSKTTYAEWADKHGFIWAQGITVPSEWVQKAP